METLLEKTLAPLGYELLELELRLTGKQRIVRVFIDAEDGIDLMDCEKASQQMSAVLDVEDPINGEYDLEVSSPGLNRKLKKAEHFKRFLGDEVKIELVRPRDGRRRYRGHIDAVTETEVTVIVDTVHYELPIADIDTARLVPTY